MPRYGRCCLVYAPMILALLSGCGKPPPQPAERAEAAVEAFLDSWSRGEGPEKFSGPNAPIEAADPDRSAGNRLLSFLTAESKQSPDHPDQVRCRVSLSMQTRKGAKVEREVVYAVQLGERTVIRRVTP